MELKFEVYAKIQKPVAEVFQAIYDPKKLSAYFTTGGASAPLEQGKTVTWGFHDFPDTFPVRVLESVKNQRITIEWDNPPTQDITVATILLEKLNDEATSVKVREHGWKPQQPSLIASYANCMGWSHMLCYLKAYLEHGINLRVFFY